METKSVLETVELILMAILIIGAPIQFVLLVALLADGLRFRDNR